MIHVSHLPQTTPSPRQRASKCSSNRVQRWTGTCPGARSRPLPSSGYIGNSTAYLRCGGEATRRRGMGRQNAGLRETSDRFNATNYSELRLDTVLQPCSESAPAHHINCNVRTDRSKHAAARLQIERQCVFFAIALLVREHWPRRLPSSTAHRGDSE